jgi:hypothetical protein
MSIVSHEIVKLGLVIGVVLILIWIAFGYFSSQVKEPAYSVLTKKDGYEIRSYAPYIEARVTVSGSYRDAMSSGFSTLAGYIFGGNVKKQSIAMTAPVIEQKSESIAMTAPIIETVVDANTRVISFVMPAEYTLQMLPVPNDSRITLAEIPSHNSAVLRYSGYNTPEKVIAMKTVLLGYLKRDMLKVVGTPRGAAYNPPWTPPFMRRNEVIVDVSVGP